VETLRTEHRFLRIKHGGFLSAAVKADGAGPPRSLRGHDTGGKVQFESARPATK
jgi:hypothetical protein